MSFGNLLQALKGGKGSGNFGHAGRKGKRGGSAAGIGIHSLTESQMNDYYYHRSTTGKTDAILNSGVIRGGLDNFGQRIYRGLWADPLDKPTVFFGVTKSKLQEYKTTMTTNVASNLKDTHLSESGVLILMYEPKDGKYYDVSNLYKQGRRSEKDLVDAYEQKL